MTRTDELKILVRDFRPVTINAKKTCLVYVPKNKVIDDEKGLVAYKFACLWTKAIAHRETYVNPITGRDVTMVNNRIIDRLYSDETLIEAYKVFMASIRYQLYTTGNIEPIKTMKDMESYLGYYKYTDEIVKRVFKNQTTADIAKDYGRLLYPQYNATSEHAKYIDRDPRDYFENYYTNKIFGKYKGVK